MPRNIKPNPARHPTTRVSFDNWLDSAYSSLTIQKVVPLKLVGVILFYFYWLSTDTFLHLMANLWCSDDGGGVGCSCGTDGGARRITVLKK